MALLINCSSVFILLLALVELAAAEVYYVGPTIGGVVGVIILILDIIAAVEILRSGKTLGGKLLWILLIVFFPIVGLIIYLLCGRTRGADL